MHIGALRAEAAKCSKEILRLVVAGRRRGADKGSSQVSALVGTRAPRLQGQEEKKKEAKTCHKVLARSTNLLLTQTLR